MGILQHKNNSHKQGAGSAVGGKDPVLTAFRRAAQAGHGHLGKGGLRGLGGLRKLLASAATKLLAQQRPRSTITAQRAPPGNENMGKTIARCRLSSDTSPTHSKKPL